MRKGGYPHDPTWSRRYPVDEMTMAALPNPAHHGKQSENREEAANGQRQQSKDHPIPRNHAKR